MAMDDRNTEEQQSRLDALMDEFRQAQRRRLVRRGLAHLNRTTDTAITGASESSLKKLN